jgi:hypothetical protein
MTTLREAAQQALEALGKWSSGRDMDAVELNDLIATLEAALEQQEQEPVAWLRRDELADLQTCNYRRLGADSPRIWAPHQPDSPEPALDLVAVFTPPPRREWQSLSEDELTALGVIHSRYQEESLETGGWFDFARAIEAALKEKNNG